MKAKVSCNYIDSVDGSGHDLRFCTKVISTADGSKVDMKYVLICQI